MTRDAFPYFALLLENFRFSSKARYVNDVHLLRFHRGAAGVRALPKGTNSTRHNLIRNIHPQPDAPWGFKGFLPYERHNDITSPHPRQ